MDHICFDRYLPNENRPTGPLVNLDGMIARAAFLVPKLWPTGALLQVAFLGGTLAQQTAVVEQLPEWSRWANLRFEFGRVPGSDIRIAFDARDGAWSYIGNDARNIPANAPTMNLGWLTGGVILHEAGHMVGMVHEHQNPLGRQIQWNKPVVNAALGGSPNYWPQSTIEHNMYARYAAAQINGSVLDPDSIMMYTYPSSWTLDGFSTHANSELSALDKLWAGFTYPGAVPPLPPTPPIPSPPEVPSIPIQERIDAGVPGTIGQPGQEDGYVFTVDRPGRYAVETLGTTDVFLHVLDAAGKILASDDDSGTGQNALLTLNLTPGVYAARVRHYARSGSGDYTIRVVRERV